MKLSVYFFRLCLMGGLLTGAILLLKLTSLSTFYLPVHPWIPLIFVSITALEHWVLYQTIQKAPKRFSTAFMGVSSLKLLLILGVTVIYLLIDKTQVLSFIMVLFVNYIVFTVFEVRALLLLVKQGN